MKKILSISLLLLLISLTVFSQSRTNRQKLTFINSSDKLTSSIGWSNNETLGEWIDYNNVICGNKDYKTKYKSLQGSWMKSQTKQNFIDIQTKTLNFKGIQYFILMVNKYDGKYEYPSIFEGWYSWKEVQGFIFTENEYKKLLDLDGEVKLETYYRVDIGSYNDDYNETIFLDLIQTKLTTEGSQFVSPITFPILKTTSENTEVIRFYLPDFFNKTYTTYNFEKEYFEVSPQEFDKIIIR